MLAYEQVLSKSKSKFDSLNEAVAFAAEKLIKNCYEKGIMVIVTQGLRSIDEQNELYAQGRTQEQLNNVGLSNVKAKPSLQKVTNARGGYSNHNFGMAIDFALLKPDGKSVTWEMNTDYNSDNVKDWIQVVDEAKKLGFEWGGDWTSFVDYPHFQILFGITLSQYRLGKRPSKEQIQAFINKIKDSEEQPMTAQEKQAFEELQAQVKSLSEQIKTMQEKENSATIPAWAADAVKAAVKAKLINEPVSGSLDFYRLITILYRGGKI